ncbi:SDR family NAD(P)-dependent oxidoreductase [Planotetraspora kaengkrachanensis]|uniref:Oxidoreductase n=1 Tax=Planotetraspora kaengkrachanensis TaxID=575193 RepID=A0A8J3LXS3_9ACTN|nr:SDR family oxidoreductase [Planotetraspora kaengkrachanensis]GIG78680.1 oxidoreductase [Planotetraspora kaengkrachanensis]
MGKLDGRIAVVTGGSSGIGAGTARHLRDEGAEVCVTDVSPPREDGGLMYLEHDVSSADAWLRVRDLVVSEFGRVDVLVNNAGIFLPGMIADISLEVWHRTLAVNQTGILLGMQTFAGALEESGRGSIVNMSSYAGMQGHGTSVAYQAAKWAVRGMTRFAAREFAPRGIRVNAVVPGFIDTPMMAAGGDALRDTVVRRTPLGRLGEVADIAYAIGYLAGDESAFVTGTEIVLDGGMLA